MGKWNPITRGIYYDPETVIRRLAYYAQEYRAHGQIDMAKALEHEIRDIKGGVSPKDGARLVIQASEFLSDKEASNEQARQQAEEQDVGTTTER